MGRPNGLEAKPDPENETRQLLFVSNETVEMIALDPSADPVGEFASQSQLNEFPCERPFLIKRVWDLTRLGEEAGGC